MIDKKNIILISMVLIVVGIVGIYFPYAQYQKYQKNLPVQNTLINRNSLVIIIYTNQGFKPDSITVKIGSTVEWINTSDKLMWVASDPHPSHTNLPGFDERGVEGVETPSPLQSLITYSYAHTGQTEYRYTFQKAGRWEYHNHLVPFDRGVVIVE